MLHLDDLRDLGTAVARCRRLLDLDADPLAITDALAGDEVIGRLVRARPGLRLPGCVNGEELVLRAVLGERLTSPAARAQTARLVATLGVPLPQPIGAVTHLFPSAAAVAEADMSSLPGPPPRRDALHRLAAQLANGQLRLDDGADSGAALPRLLAIPGRGAAAYVAMRGLHDPDALPLGEPGLRRALRNLGHTDDRRSFTILQQRWRPWRAYAALHLWTSMDDAAGSARRASCSDPQQDALG